jgi:hypothetical protein
MAKRSSFVKSKDYRHPLLYGKSYTGIGVQHGVCERVEDGRRPLARRAEKGRAWKARVKL